MNVNIYSESESYCRVPRELLDRVLDPITSEGYINAKHEICALMAKPAEQQQGEPVELQHVAVAECGQLRWMSGRQMVECELYAMPDGSAIRSKLYTHADPNVRWKAVADEQMQVIAGLRAQLAERGALLREKDDVLMAVKEQFDRHGNSFPDRFDSRVFRWVNDAVASASAEPSAPDCATCNDEGAVGNILDTVPCPDCAAAPPVERDEQDLFEKKFPIPNGVMRGGDYGYQCSFDVLISAEDFRMYMGAWAAWKARAALESKP